MLSSIGFHISSLSWSRLPGLSCAADAREWKFEVRRVALAMTEVRCGGGATRAMGERRLVLLNEMDKEADSNYKRWIW